MRYFFKVELSGQGNNAVEAWNDAVDAFSADPGEPWTVEEEQEEEEHDEE